MEAIVESIERTEKEAVTPKEELAVNVQDVTRRFGDFIAVNHLSFEVRKGEIFGLLGPNGAGKTTTINMITGMLKLHGGKIAVAGLDPRVDAKQMRKKIGLVPQETNVYQDLNAVDNLWHHAALYCDDLSNVKDRIQELLEMVSLWERRKDPVRTFSGGMKRRLALARALLHDPEIILFDEPTVGVDVQGKHVLWDHIRTQEKRGKTFIVSSNDMAEVEVLCQRLVIIDRGKAIAIDTPENLRAGLGRDIVTLHATPEITDAQALFNPMPIQNCSNPEPGIVRFEIANAESVVGDLVSRVTKKHRMEWFRISRPSLDDVFLHYTGRSLRE